MKKFNLFVVFFLLAGVIMAAKTVSLPGIYNPKYVFVQKDYVYIVEGTTVNIFSGKDFKLIKKFGKQGEGPQEFKGVINGIYFPGENMVVSSIGRASFFTPDGNFIKEKNIVAGMGWDFIPIGDGFIGRGMKQDKETRFRTFNLFDSNLKKVKEFYKIKHPFQERKGMRVFELSGISFVHDNKIFLSYGKGFLIEIFNDKGEKLPSIKRDDYPLIELTEKYKEAVYYFYKTNPRTKDRFDLIKERLVFPKYLNAIRDFYAADKKVYIRTYKIVDNKTEFFIYHTNGKFIKKVLLPTLERGGFEYATYRYTVGGGKFYQLFENADTEEWELHISEIPPE